MSLGLSVVGSTVWFMDAGVRCYGEELVAVLSAATAVLKDLPAEVHRLTGADLDAVLPVVDAPGRGRRGGPVHGHRGGGRTR